MAVRIERINHRFEGEFLHGKKTYSVPFVLPGDLVHYKLVRRGRKRKALIEQIERKDPPDNPDLLSRDPGCLFAGRCGGCKARHISYTEQFRIKAEPILQEMKELFGVVPELQAAGYTDQYRNRMDFVVEQGWIGLRGVGDYKAFIDIDSCPNQRPEANHVLALLRNLLSRSSGVSKDRQQDSGVLKYATIRSGDASGALILTVDQKEIQDERYLQFKKELVETFRNDPVCKTFTLVEAPLADPLSEVSAPPGGSPLYGDGFFYEKLGGIRFRVPYDSFFQPNPRGFDPILDWSIRQIQSQTIPPGGMLDLYSGAGVLSSILYQKTGGSFDRITGMDSVASSIELSSSNFPEDSPPLDFQVVDLGRPPEEMFTEHKYSLIVADPPRAGLSPGVRKGIRHFSSAPFFLYISCNPHSQIEDLHQITRSYEPIAAFLTDPFPHTPHLEQAIWMKKKESI